MNMTLPDSLAGHQLVRLSKIQPGDILVHPETGDRTLAQDYLGGIFVDDHGRTAIGTYVYRKVADPTLPADLAGYQNVRRGFVLKGDLLIYDDGEREFATEDDNECEIIGTGECPALHGKSQSEPETWGACRVYRKIPTPKQTIGNDQATVMKARTYDDGKAPLAYMPWAALDEMAMVQAYGKSKYGSFWNYRLGMEVGRNLSCAIRHIRDFMEGHDLDDESKRSHLGHAMCRIAFTLQNIKDGKAIDDRYKP